MRYHAYLPRIAFKELDESSDIDIKEINNILANFTFAYEELRLTVMDQQFYIEKLEDELKKHIGKKFHTTLISNTKEKENESNIS